MRRILDRLGVCSSGTVKLGAGQLWLLLACVCISSVAASSAPQAQYGTSRASLLVSENVRDFGRTSFRKEWAVAFQVHNAGTRRLVLNETNGACACRTATRTTIIPAGGSADLNITLDTRFTVGPAETVASFTTNDPDHPHLHLIVRAWVH